MPDATCEICAGPILRTSERGPLPKVCSPECRREKHRLWSAEQYRQGKRPYKPKQRTPTTCEQCGDTFPGRSNQRFCSVSCTNRANYQNRIALGWQRRRTSTTEYFNKVCTWCGKAYVTSRRPGRYCSNSCARYGTGTADLTCELTWRYCKHCDISYPHGLCPQRDTHPTKAPPDMASRPCVSCGTPFTPLRPAGYSAAYCSPTCRNREASARRRANQGSNYEHRTDRAVGRVRRHAIYERDRWVCQLCRRKVNPKLTVPHPQAATLDHVLPVSLGGTHDEWNLQLAHFGCNSKKRNKVHGEGEQLRLAV